MSACRRLSTRVCASEDAVQARNFLAGQEPRERRRRFRRTPSVGEVSMRPQATAVVHDLAQHVEGAIGGARRRPAVAIEPLPDPGRRNAVERSRPERG